MNTSDDRPRLIEPVIEDEPPRTLGHVERECEQDSGKQTLKSQGEPPGEIAVLRKIAPETDARGEVVADAETQAVLADQEASRAGRRQFGGVHGEENEDHADADAGKEAEEEKHGYIDGTRCKRTAYDDNDTSYLEGLWAAITIGGPGIKKATQEPTDLR